MRFGRLFFGLAVILFTVWIIIGEQITGVSSDAVVNARLLTIRAPIAGRLEIHDRYLGTFIGAGEDLATLDDEWVNITRLNDLRMERAFAASEVERLVAFAAEPPTTKSMESYANPEVLTNRSPRTDTQVGRSELAVYLNEARQRLAAIDVRIADENVQIARLANARLINPSDAVMWEFLADNGEVVQRGQDIIKLMLCGTELVTLSVPANVYNRLSIGQVAKFRLNNNSKVYDGYITRLAGSGASTIYRNLAVAPSNKHVERYDIMLLVTELRDDPKLRCSVGQTGRVFFETRPLDWVRDLVK